MNNASVKPNGFKQFIVAAQSSNANSFGLVGYILIARDGEAWEVGRSLSFPWSTGQVVKVPMQTSQLTWAALSCELPRRLPVAPAAVVNEIWNSRNKVKKPS